MKYFLEDRSWIAIRPSGIEAKLKFYIATKGKTEAESLKKVDGIKDDLNKIIDTLI